MCVVSVVQERTDVKKSLIEAAREGRVECIKALVQKELELNKALIETPKEGYVECVQTLIEEISTLNKALIEAIREGHGECVEVLVHEGADVDKALLEAAKQGLVKCVQGLLEKGANVMRALEEEYSHCKYYFVTKVLDTEYSHYYDFKCRKENGHETFIGTLIQAGADVNKYENLKDTSPVMCAVNRDNTRCLEMLITAGAAVNVALGYYGYTPFAQAAFDGHENSLKCLLQDGSHIFCIGNYRQDRSYDYIECVKLSLEAGADVYALAAECFTALTFAVESGFTECAEVLMKEGNIDVNKRYEYSSMTLLMYAAVNRQMKLLDFLLGKGADVNARNNSGYTALIWAVGQRYDEGVEKLIAAGADVNERSSSGYTALITAAEQGYHECVERLIDAGADVNASDERGHTALIKASQAACDDVVEKLIAAGADVNKVTDSSITALTAIINSRGKNLRCTQLVLRAGANADANILSTIPHYELEDTSTNMKMLLYAAGLPINSPFEEEELSLMNTCRKTIRCHLMSLSPINLFYKVEELKSTLPSLLCSFLLYDMSLDVEYENPRPW